MLEVESSYINDFGSFIFVLGSWLGSSSDIFSGVGFVSGGYCFSFVVSMLCFNWSMLVDVFIGGKMLMLFIFCLLLLLIFWMVGVVSVSSCSGYGVGIFFMDVEMVIIWKEKNF